MAVDPNDKDKEWVEDQIPIKNISEVEGKVDLAKVSEMAAKIREQKKKTNEIENGVINLSIDSEKHKGGFEEIKQSEIMVAELMEREKLI